MTADEIRRDMEVDGYTDRFLREIAAQLAELNEKLERVINPVNNRAHHTIATRQI